VSDNRPVAEIFNELPPTRPKRIALVAGEASGDLLGADLIQQLRLRWPGAEFVGVGGAAMRDAGMETWFDASELAVMGLSEVLRHLPRLLRLRRELRERVLGWQPDVFIGIDAPDFNLGVEKWLKQRGVRTVHYVSPSVWAWREKRAARIGESADLVLCLFPMEPPIYARHDVDARFVGHPLADTMPLVPDRDAARATLGLDPQRPMLALLPGSRVGEIQRLGADFIGAAARVLAAEPTLQVIAPMAGPQARDAFQAILSSHPDATALSRALSVVDGQSRTAMVASDVILLASGTATLEAMLAKRPMVVAYKVSAFTYLLVKTLGMLKVDHYALPNMLAGEEVVPELMQDDCGPEALADACLKWLRGGDTRALQSRFLTLHDSLRRGASAQAAQAIVELVS